VLGTVVIALAAAAAIAIAPRLPPRVERVVFAAALAVTIAACMGRAAWNLAPALSSPILALWTIEAFGVFPTVPALVFAGVGLVSTIATVLLSRQRVDHGSA
jgi:hypothetical protein